MKGRMFWPCAVIVFVVAALLSPFSLVWGEDPATHGRIGAADWHLSLDELIARVCERNERIRYQKLEWDISRDAVKSAGSIFEPRFVASYLHDKSNIPKTVEDMSSIGFMDVDDAGALKDNYWKRNNEYNAAVEGVLPTGAQVRFGYSLKRLQNSLMDNYAYDSQYQTFVGTTVVQPLLKNAGVDTTMANIRVAEKESAISLQGYRRELLQVVAEAASSYWNLCLAQEKLKVRRESLRIAEDILRDNKERFRTGKMAETEVLEAEAGLALRKSLEIAASQELTAAVNNIKTLLSLPRGDMDGMVIAMDNLAAREVAVEYESSYLKSIKNRPEYLSALMKVEREGIRIAYAENQRWPQLDLKASYGVNGLDRDNDGPIDSLDVAKGMDYESWSVGLELSIPLMGGKKTKSELAAAKKRKAQILLELKATEVALANAVDTSIKNVMNAAAQGKNYASAVQINKRLLEVELARLSAGKSNSRLVLERDEELNRAKEYYLESLVNVEKALVALEAVKGTLLQMHGIDLSKES